MKITLLIAALVLAAPAFAAPADEVSPNILTRISHDELRSVEQLADGYDATRARVAHLAHAVQVWFGDLKALADEGLGAHLSNEALKVALDARIKVIDRIATSSDAGDTYEYNHRRAERLRQVQRDRGWAVTPMLDEQVFTEPVKKPSLMEEAFMYAPAQDDVIQARMIVGGLGFKDQALDEDVLEAHDKQYEALRCREALSQFLKEKKSLESIRSKAVYEYKQMPSKRTISQRIALCDAYDVILTNRHIDHSKISLRNMGSKAQRAN